MAIKVLEDLMDNLYRTAIENSFKENFEKYKDKKIVLYGTGYIARFIVDKYYNYNIIGFLDGNKNHGTTLGKKIFSYEEAVEQKPDIIIVAAKKNYIKTIYDRICYMCYTNKIQLYSVDGRNLFTAFGYGGLSSEQEKYGEISESMLKDEILKHDIISFDIFDVLLMRKILRKTDLFNIVEKRLSKEGIQIPNYRDIRLELEAQVLTEGGNIYDIYKKLANSTEITFETAEKALKTELAVDCNIICIRDKMKELLLFAVKSGKKVYLLADTYLSADFIKGILNKHGIIQYEDMFLSSEYHVTKAQGLYDTFKATAQGHSYLHISANSDEDTKYAQESLIDIFKIPSPYDMLLASSYRNLQYSINSINERSMAGLLAAKLFADPFALHQKEGRPEIESIYDFGYIFVAPLITKYVLWIIDEAKKGQYDNLLFAARDGFITHKLYTFAIQQLKIDIPKGIYFQTSRILCTNSTVRQEEDIVWNAMTPHANPPELMLAERFNLDSDAIEQYNSEKYPDVLSYALSHKKKIYEKSEQVRNNYLLYMNNIGLQENKKYAFVDFVSSGTCQQTLNKFIYFNIEGLYLCKYWTNNEEKFQLPGNALFENLCEEFVYCCYAYEKYLLLESMMTSFQPSLASMDEKGQPIYRKETRNEEEMKYVRDIHNAIEDYFCDYISNFYIEGREINKHFTDTIFSYREQKYTNEHCSAFDNLVLLEDFGQWKMLLDRNY